MSYFQRRDARRYPSSSIVLISLRGEQPVFPRLEAKNGQGASVCVLPVIRRKPEGFPALELVDEVQGDVLISLVRGGLDVVVHANGEITLSNCRPAIPDQLTVSVMVLRMLSSASMPE